MNKYLILAFAVSLLLIIAVDVVRADVEDVMTKKGICVNSSHYQGIIEYEINGTDYDAKDKPVYCPYGCIDEANHLGAGCMPISPFFQNLIFISIIIFLIYLIRRAMK